MRIIKVSFLTIFLIGIFSLVYLYKDNISKYIVENFIVKRNVIVTTPNKYYKDNRYAYIDVTDNFYPSNKDEIVEVFYTIINSGWNEFTFFCSTEYEDCIDDVKKMTSNGEVISNLNNFVHPFNSYKKLQIELNSLGKIVVHVEKIYSNEEIDFIDNKIDNINNEILKPNMTDKEKIKIFHDYIADNTQYDSKEAELIINNTEINDEIKSYKATNVLINGLGLCGGYTDTLAIFLEKLGIENYKISNAKHIWNYVNLDNKWYHIDLTWDDPVTSDGSNMILYDFFLISTEELEKMNTNQHNYDKNIFIEAK